MRSLQFRSKCCNSCIIQDFSYENDESETPKYRCAKCHQIVESVKISGRIRQTK